MRSLASPPRRTEDVGFARALAATLAPTLGWVGLLLWLAATLACATAWAPRAGSGPPPTSGVATR